MRITTHAGVHAVLSGPEFQVPSVPDPDGAAGVRWLRATVARFSTGPTHDRRRMLATTALAGIDPAGLRRHAGARTSRILAAADGRPVDLMARVARIVPVDLLAGALGMAGGTAGAVRQAATAYHPHADVTPAADRAVDHLVRACGGVTDEETAARIGLLMQAADATAGLVGNAVLALRRWRPPGPTAAVLDETLRHDPPVRVTRRLATAATRVGDAAVPAGTIVQLDLAAANRDRAVFPDADRFDASRASAGRHLAFGSGPRACPGSAHAVAIATGIVDALRRCQWRVDRIRYQSSANLRVPVVLAVRAR